MRVKIISKISKWVLVIFCFIPFTSTIIAQVPVSSNPFWGSAEWNWNTTGMIWRDANNDGYIDVFFSNGNDITLSPNTVHISQFGELPATATWFSSNAEYSGHCAVGDIDDNGFPDFIVANFLGQSGFSSPNRANLYYNQNGLPNIAPDWYSNELFYSFSCALGDFDNDGDLDLVMATGEGYNNISENDLIYFNDNGSFQTTAGWQSALPTQSIDVTAGDIDNDGDLDLVFCYDDNGVALYYNNSGSIETTPSWHSDETEPTNTVITGDVNNDGWLDIIVAYNNQLGGSGKFRVYYNDGAGNINPSPGWESSTGGYGSSVTLYDYDNDGDDDLTAGRWWDRPRIYENTGATFTSTPVWQAAFSTVVEEMAWIDIDGDGVEQLADTIAQPDTRKLFYTSRHPLQAIDSVIVDGNLLALDEYCYDLISGWVSLSSAPVSEVIISYRYSYTYDLTVANWDTSSFAYANTNLPLVQFSADTIIGWAPLTVHFTDNSIGATNQFWRFGDGNTGDGANPIHTYDSSGIYDVTLENILPDGWHNHTSLNMITVLADTLIFDTVVALTYGTVKVPIYLHNSQPLNHITLPVIYSGDAPLTYTGFDTDSCRTDYFANVTRTHSDASGKKLSFSFNVNTGSSNNPPLSPGFGRIINLYFTTTTGGITPIDTITFSSQTLNLDAGYVEYQPRVNSAIISVRPCGDIDGDFAGPNVADLYALVAYLFQGGDEPSPVWIGNVDGIDDINVADLSYLVGYLFQGGPFPACPQPG